MPDPHLDMCTVSQAVPMEAAPCPPGYDPEVWQSLPLELRLSLLADGEGWCKILIIPSLKSPASEAATVTQSLWHKDTVTPVSFIAAGDNVAASTSSSSAARREVIEILDDDDDDEGTAPVTALKSEVGTSGTGTAGYNEDQHSSAIQEGLVVDTSGGDLLKSEARGIGLEHSRKRGGHSDAEAEDDEAGPLHQRSAMPEHGSVQKGRQMFAETEGKVGADGDKGEAKPSLKVAPTSISLTEGDKPQQSDGKVRPIKQLCKLLFVDGPRCFNSIFLSMHTRKSPTSPVYRNRPMMRGPRSVHGYQKVRRAGERSGGILIPRRASSCSRRGHGKHRQVYQSNQWKPSWS